MPEEISLAAQLAWEYVNKGREGKKPQMWDYLNKLPDTAARDEFRNLVALNDFAECLADLSAQGDLDQALSELPKDKPDVI